MEASEFTELIPSLPQELGLDCLSRLPYPSYYVASAVCCRWRQLLLSREFYHHRKKFGHTHQVACLVQALSARKISDHGRKRRESLSYGLTLFDPVSQVWSRLDPLPNYPNGLPLFCQLVGCEGKLVVMGGWDPVSYEPVCDVFVYDFTLQIWRKGKNMPIKMSFFAVGSHSGRVYVAGGHDENKNALRTGWVYDLRLDMWNELPQLSQERDECEGVVIGDEYWVVSGYATENQGAFDGSADVYNIGSGQWKRVEGVWEPGRCPRSNVGVGKDGNLLNWSELDPAVRAGSCGIMLGNRALVTGSEYQGGPHGLYMVEMGPGRSVKLEKINEGDDYCGFVQSGCCVEI